MKLSKHKTNASFERHYDSNRSPLAMEDTDSKLTDKPAVEMSGFRNPRVDAVSQS